MTTEKAVDEFMSSAQSLDEWDAIWKVVVDEVQNGDEDIALNQAARLVNVRHHHNYAFRVTMRHMYAFRPALLKRGLVHDYPISS